MTPADSTPPAAPPEERPLAREEPGGERDVEASVGPESSLVGEVRAFQERWERAQTRRDRSLWAQLAYVSALGWMIALPIAGGALLGHLIDQRLGTGITWTLALMFAGIGAAGYFGWKTMFMGGRGTT